jgi:hypothetical protein
MVQGFICIYNGIIVAKSVIPAKAGIQKNTGFRVKPGMTNCVRLISPCIGFHWTPRMLDSLNPYLFPHNVHTQPYSSFYEWHDLFIPLNLKAIHIDEKWEFLNFLYINPKFCIS